MGNHDSWFLVPDAKESLAICVIVRVAEGRNERNGGRRKEEEKGTHGSSWDAKRLTASSSWPFHAFRQDTTKM